MQVRRTLFVGLAAVLGAVVFASTAAAAPPVKTTFSNVPFSSVMSGTCPFDVTVDSVFSGFEIDYFDQAGTFVKAQIHQTEVDTFSANGKTLTGIPYTFNLDFRFDSSGNATQLLATGVASKVLLPDGSLFVSAGQVDFLAHPGATFVLSADPGNPGNVAGFCAALA